MIGALWILLFIIVVGIVLYLFELRGRRKDGASESASDEALQEESAELPEQPEAEADSGHESNGVCCGMHLVCEKDSLSPVSTKVEYYDDEELDRFIGREADSYTPEETDEFQDVLLTLRPEDAPGWARSITMRRINLPPVVRDELLMIVNEQRNK